MAQIVKVDTRQSVCRFAMAQAPVMNLIFLGKAWAPVGGHRQDPDLYLFAGLALPSLDSMSRLGGW